MSIKEDVTKELTKKLGEIADAVVKNLSNPATTTTTPAASTTTQKSEPGATTPAQTTTTPATAPADGELTKKLDELTSTVKSLLDMTPESKSANLTKKQSDVQAQVVELVKQMGIDPENVDVQFVVKEKKKGTTTTQTSGKFTKSNTDNVSGEPEDEPEVTTPGEESFEKEFNTLDADGKKEALSFYFKKLLFN